MNISLEDACKILDSLREFQDKSFIKFCKWSGLDYNTNKLIYYICGYRKDESMEYVRENY